MSPVVAINPNILGGTPVFAGTRVPVESLFDHLKRGGWQGLYASLGFAGDG